MISKEFHASRRALYQNLLENNSMAFVFAGESKEDRGDQMHPFTPYANFYYLTGFDQPKAVLMTVKTGGKVTETLFIDHPDAMRARWEGVSYDRESVQQSTGIEHVEYLERFEEKLPMAGRSKYIEHLYVDIATWEQGFGRNPAQEFASKMMSCFPYLQMHNTFSQLALMRQVKDREEIELHREACRITTEGVRNILTHLHPDMYEYEIEAHFDYTLKANHARHAFGTIAASGPNACVLHYMKNDRKMQDGDMILFDLGAEYGYYASDVSRTFPVNGHFTPQQKDLYNVVLKGLEAAIARTRPGQPKNELQEISKAVMAQELIRLGMIREPEEIMKYYFHSSGHYIGLYTHDVGNDEAILEPDMMFTLEPGLYFEELGIGIRIEDTILITEDGCDVLTAGIPKTVEEIEAFMAAHK
ncbi:MAG TPA: aminopeptidase P family protein [Candidatus Blautia gallistercoris]|uniref:Xaa-Pro aminopeptidase n=1 Tax=Candidatus Blautia gallistercoris TaxID=2838490 RepID=A0A9D2B4U5_9FIRM|nr:aminopeptidase P family protein [Candidatus Blautia gallistercoris]